MSKQEEFKQRTKAFGLRVVKLVQSLGDDRIGRVLGNQLLRSGTSVGANYRAACRARSAAEFRAKLGICEEECDESMYWIELLVDSELIRAELVEPLLAEANELLSMIVASINTSRNK
ncbi:hypothetical protein KOR34_32150 [Posidoniimonas corsicana]|uniref:Four helix bundle protein n=1 Tax=Posidoniimonas corsicana TaxID=1938618 RepID=A0A5C5VI24_9BACT|nr:four helix bundle protein [Posidoniimonas corsicana]TWT38246.1 hypothetical protein KOR34_32150 [Posidoniimonas corsicana]